MPAQLTVPSRYPLPFPLAFGRVQFDITITTLCTEDPLLSTLRNSTDILYVTPESMFLTTIFVMYKEAQKYTYIYLPTYFLSKKNANGIFRMYMFA